MSNPNKVRTPTFGEGDVDTVPPAPDALGGVPLTILGTTGGEGGGERFIRTDATLAVFDTTLPVAVAATAATGSAVRAARRDHRHGITDNISTQKVQVADQETLIGTRKRLNFIANGAVTITITDNATFDRVDIEISV